MNIISNAVVLLEALEVMEWYTMWGAYSRNTDPPISCHLIKCFGKISSASSVISVHQKPDFEITSYSIITIITVESHVRDAVSNLQLAESTPFPSI